MQADDPRELSGPVGDEERDDQVAPRGGQPVADDRAERRRVDVAAGQHRARRALAADAAGDERRDGRGAGTLDDELRALEEEHDRLGDLLVVDDDDVVEQLVEDRAR